MILSIDFFLETTGPGFLVAYAILLVLAFRWSLKIRQNCLNSFNPREGSNPQLDDPYQVAYLAGGITRCGEVAIASLVEKGAIVWKPAKKIKESRLHEIGPCPDGLHWFEKSLFSPISLRGKTGIALTSLGAAITNGLPSLESQLATLGLRPTREELRSKVWQCTLPLLFMTLVGALKILIGHSAGNPIGFLTALVILSIASIFIILQGVRILSPAGETLLKEMKGGRTSTSEPGLVNLALFGIAKATAYAKLPGLDPTMIQELDKMNQRRSGTSGCGGNNGWSGCGSSGCSGCGGGGCGGCGGS